VRSERSKLGRWAGITLAAATIVGGALVVAACSNGGEGDRCDFNAENSGDDDCQNGLICWQAAMLSGAGSDLCCPPDRAQATTAACAIPAAAPGVDAAIPADTGTGDDGGTDGAVQSDGDDSATTDGPASETSTGDGATSDGETGDGASSDGDDGG
jgi:hypothetical protein